MALEIEPEVTWERYGARWKAKGLYFPVFEASIASQVCAHMWHTKGTLIDFVGICCFLLPYVPHVCAILVPVGCT